MEMKKIALIDIDGCFSDYPNSLFLELVRKETGLNFNSKEQILDSLGISKYNLYKSMLRINGLKIKYNFRAWTGDVHGFSIYRNMSKIVAIVSSTSRSFLLMSCTSLGPHPHGYQGKKA